MEEASVSKWKECSDCGGRNVPSNSRCTRCDASFQTELHDEPVFFLQEPELFWGDYGHILVDGMSCHLPRKDGLIQLERTGPFVPPITFPGFHRVVTDELKQNIEASQFTGMEFLPVIKAHIVNLDWHLWDKTCDEPDQYPESGEPEDYLLGAPHSDEMANQIGNLWELRVRPSTTIEFRGNAVVMNTWSGEDTFRGQKTPLYVSSRFKTFLEETAGEWVKFRIAPMI